MGHGNHWEAVLGDTELIIPKAIEPTVKDGEIVGSFDPPSSERPQTWNAMVYPQMPLQYLILLSSEQSVNDIISAYPFGHDGVSNRMVVEEVLEWENGGEAQLVAVAGANEAPLTFFDSLYYKNKGRYVPGEAVDIELSGIAYTLKKAKQTKFSVVNPILAEALKQMPGSEELARKAAEGEEVRISTAGAAILLPIESADPDEYSFQVPITQVTSFELDGIRIYKLRVTLLRLEVDVEAFLYASEHSLQDGYVPQVDDDVSGVLWLQGYLSSDR